MKQTLSRLEEQYKSSLGEYLARGGEPALQNAYELGRRALGEGLGVLDMAALHHEALQGVLKPKATPAQNLQVIAAAGNFFVESLSAFEMTHRGFREANAALRRLNQTLEEEAKRIAHSLHDEAGQLLASVHIALAEVSRDLPSVVGERLSQIQELLDQIEIELRRLSHELRPTILDDLGLIPALKFLAEGVSTRTRTPVRVESSLQDRLPPLIETTIYRIVQEALANVSKHARANQALVLLERRYQTIRCSVRDDGVGFDPSAALNGKVKRGLGLLGVRERLNALGGTLVINSNLGQGTELVLTIPVPMEP